MGQNVKVNIFLVIIALGAIFIAIFALGNSDSDTMEYCEYNDCVRVLTDTIKVLKEDIAKYEAEIARIDLERESIRKELELIIRDNEKIDTELANGDWDSNIRFLTDFLSKKDSVGK